MELNSLDGEHGRIPAMEKYLRRHQDLEPYAILDEYDVTKGCFEYKMELCVMS